jgi:hypothetical protein
MPRILQRTCPLALTVALVAGAAVAPGAAVAAGPAPSAQAAKKKKKKKKPAPLTATISGTFTIKENIEGGFGNDSGPNWQQLKVELKGVDVPFRDGEKFGGAKATATFTYHAEANTSDRSWHAGCDSETVESNGTWTGKTTVSVRETKYLLTKGKSKSFAGWQVRVAPPEDFPLTSKGSYTDWDSILMTECQTFVTSKPLGGWSAGFASPDGVGGLADDNRSVPLMSINTELNQTGTASGKLKFNKAPR